MWDGGVADGGDGGGIKTTQEHNYATLARIISNKIKPQLLHYKFDNITI